jgi:hypothetical protein
MPLSSGRSDFDLEVDVDIDIDTQYILLSRYQV